MWAIPKDTNFFVVRWFLCCFLVVLICCFNRLFNVHFLSLGPNILVVRIVFTWWKNAGEINMFESCSADFTRVIRSLAANVGDPWSALLVAGNIPTSTFGWKNFPQIGLKIDGEMEWWKLWHRSCVQVVRTLTSFAKLECCTEWSSQVGKALAVASTKKSFGLLFNWVVIWQCVIG